MGMAVSKGLSSQVKIPVEKYQLSNGLTVLLNQDSKLNTASYFLGYKVGSRHEKPGHTGISHMFEHLMFKGTKKYPDFNQIYSKNGVVSVNAFTSFDYTAYYATFGPEQLELILDVESDRMVNLILTEDLLNTERKAVQEERRLRVDNSPTGLLFENLLDLSFSRHPYRQPIIGYSQDIQAYTLKSLKDWYQTYYSPNNAVLVLSGAFSKRKAKRAIEKYFGPLERKKIPAEVVVKEPEPRQARRKEVKKDIQSPLVAWSYLGPPAGTREYYALNFLADIMGAGESSLLYKTMVREKKLLSSISVSHWDLSQASLFLIFYPLLDLSKEKEVKQALEQQIYQDRDQILNPESLDKVKNIAMTEMIDRLKKSRSRARLLLDYEINFEDYSKLYEQLDFMETVEPEFIKQVGQTYLQPERLNSIILKPDK